MSMARTRTVGTFLVLAAARSAGAALVTPASAGVPTPVVYPAGVAGGYTASVYAAGLAVNGEVTQLTIDPATRTFYYTGEDVYSAPLRSLSAAGAVSVVTPSFTTNQTMFGFANTGIAYAAGGVYTVLWNLNGGTPEPLVRVDAATGAVTTVHAFAGFGQGAGLAVVGNTVYASSGSGSPTGHGIDGRVAAYDLTTGVETTTRATGTFQPSVLSYAAGTGQLYAAGFAPANPVLGTFADVGPGAGTPAFAATLNGGAEDVFNFVADPTGRYLYARAGSRVWQVDTATGTDTPLVGGLLDTGSAGFAQGLVFGPSSAGTGESLYVADGAGIVEVGGFPAPAGGVPEPASLATLSLAVVALLGRRRNRS